MKKITIIQDTKKYVNFLKNKGKIIGFVPTMGALHAGHISLLEISKNETDTTIASIFLNPLQFNDKKDLEKYPRTFESDVEKLEAAGCDVLFAPTVKEMYPVASRQSTPDSYRDASQQPTARIDLGVLDKVMEGKHRPGHFQGVCAAVKRLFEIVEPDKAYFGEKDFQQVAVIKHMVRVLGLPVEIIPCPTLREPDGLAMSSRNALLGTEERKAAPLISKVLFESKEKIKNTPIEGLKKWAGEKINSNPFLKLEYFEVVDAETLASITNRGEAKSLRACIAVKAGNVRLIDNVSL